MKMRNFRTRSELSSNKRMGKIVRNFIGLIILLSLTSCGCSSETNVDCSGIFEKDEDTRYLPVIGKRTVFDVDVEELSGLCLNKDKTALLSCGDQGVVKTISFEGKVTEIFEYDTDMEGVTLDPETGDIYLAIEGAQIVAKLAAPDYNDFNTVFPVQEAIDNGYSNGGLEGIEFYKDDILFVGSQTEANLWQYHMDGTMISKVSLSAFATEVAGMCYDPVDDRLWIVDSNEAELYLVTVDGKLEATYSLGKIENAESVCLDRERGCIWVGSDEYSPKLYRYETSF